MPWRGPSYPGELPTLGYGVLDWIGAYLAAPDRAEYEPLQLTREQAQFILNYYALDAVTCRRRVRRAVLSRAKGWGKSPLLAAIAAAEALAPVVPAGWDAAGEPVGRPWADLRTPWVQIAAVSEDQTKNAWIPLLEMLREGPVVDAYPGLEPLDTFVNLPRGRIEFVTSSPTSREGNRPVFCVLDQTEEWVASNGGIKMAATLRRNLAKTGGTSIEAPNAFVPGRDSVSERSATYARKISEGRAREEGLLYDHREAPADTDLTDRESLRAGLVYAYGDSAVDAGGWVDLERLIAEIWDPDNDPQDSRLYLLNQITHAADAWLSAAEIAGIVRTDLAIRAGDTITLGFDGSRQRSDAVTDATALVGCRLSDGHLFTVRVWEQPDGPLGEGWKVPVDEVTAEVRDAFATWRVVGFYADPARWETWVAKWEADYGPQLQVKATRDNPVEWWMTGGRATRVVRALAQFHDAVIDREISYDGSSVLTRHLRNARRRYSRSGVQIAKDNPESSKKIDAAVAAVLAVQARLDAIASGVKPPGPVQIPSRIR